jgi:hypothetical protein
MHYCGSTAAVSRNQMKARGRNVSGKALNNFSTSLLRIVSKLLFITYSLLTLARGHSENIALDKILDLLTFP